MHRVKLRGFAEGENTATTAGADELCAAGAGFTRDRAGVIERRCRDADTLKILVVFVEDGARFGQLVRGQSCEQRVDARARAGQQLFKSVGVRSAPVANTIDHRFGAGAFGDVGDDKVQRGCERLCDDRRILKTAKLRQSFAHRRGVIKARGVAVKDALPVEQKLVACGL